MTSLIIQAFQNPDRLIILLLSITVIILLSREQDEEDSTAESGKSLKLHAPEIKPFSGKNMDFMDFYNWSGLTSIMGSPPEAIDPLCKGALVCFLLQD